MVDATQAKKLINPYVDWKNRPYDSSRSQEAEKREALRKAFVDFVRENGGWIVSPPGSRIAVIETVRDSPLPAKLAQLGYAIQELANGERLIGGGSSPTTKINPRRGYGVSEPGATATMQIARYEIVLPWAGR